MPEHTETEVKLYCPDLAAVAQKLEAAGAELVAPRVFERNVRYEDAAESLSANGIVVRLRQDSRTRLTYKGPGTITHDIMQRFEAEVEVSDFDTMALILDNLGYHPHMIYEKYRTTYALADAEIVLDEMPYGNFIEIEGPVRTIEDLIARLHLQTAPRFGHSYAQLFTYVRQNLHLDFTDLTFANFAGLTVTPSAFAPPTEGTPS
jgi:adenylate cyclase, class 2